MDSKSATHIENLKKALLALNATGPNGFEGLLAVVLSVICQQPFRLASSGSQRGRDGDSAFDDGATYFEAKRYDGKVPKKEITDKLFYLKADNQGQVDTWILGATSEIPAVNSKDFLDVAAEMGIGLVLLDWSDTTIPTLAIALSIADRDAKGFLKNNLTKRSHKTLLTGASSAIDHLRTLPEFNPISNELINKLKPPSVGLGIAKNVNHQWFQAVFSNQVKARQYFGQPLAPYDPCGLSVYPRIKLRESLSHAFSGTPGESVFVVIGDEGAGKSWIVADSWQSTSPASMLALATADELNDPDDIYNLEDFLIRVVVRETDETPSNKIQARWRRRFEFWRANRDPENVRVTLWIDGLNQAPDFPWARWIDAAACFMEQLGGQLVITTRRTHFGQLRDAISSKVNRIIIPDWSPEELTEILSTRGIDGNVLDADVFNTLRNPRILGIAVKLLDASQIENIQELSVGRLLFEHLRMSDRVGTTKLTAAEFAKTLQELAQKYVERIKGHQHDDLKLFDARLDQRLRAVSSSRFFNPVGDDPDVYEVREEGLQLALGLWLVSTQERELRNGREPSAQLHITLEPISALDMTADVIRSAVEIACLRGSCPIEVISALIQQYVSLQNLSEDGLEAFSALVKQSPDAFVQAAEAVALSAEHVPNKEWLTYALLNNRDDETVWASITTQVCKWLSYYSLSPERMMHSSPTRDSQEKVTEERDQCQTKVDQKVANLSAKERQNMTNKLLLVDFIDLEELHQLALTLLTGRPLSEFAQALFNWAFANALNSSIYSPSSEFRTLIRFNRQDWQNTRRALLDLLEDINGEEQSSVGAWTTVEILSATGDLNDAVKAKEIAEELTKDREKFGPWRLVENYCSADPCDPASIYPENIKETAANFRMLDATILHLGMSHTSEDHFVQMALAGIARFEPEAGINLIRSFSKDVVNRDGLSRRQGIFDLQKHSAVLDQSIIDEFIHTAQLSEGNPSRDAPEIRNDWLSSQYSMLLALPHLDGNEQLEAIGGLQGSAILLDMLRLISPADESKIEEWLIRADETADEDMQIRILAALTFSGATLSERSKDIVAKLISSTNKIVKMEALGVAVSTDEKALIQTIAASEWNAGQLNPDKDKYEIWYGSTALIAAAESGMLDIPETLNRIALTHYGTAALRLGADAAILIADRISEALEKVLGLGALPNLPRMETDAILSFVDHPPLMNFLDDHESSDIKSSFKRLSETPEEFNARQIRAEKAFQRFSKGLTDAEAGLVLADLGFEGISSVISTRPDLIEPWCNAILAASQEVKRSLYLFSLQLACALASTDISRTEALIKAFEDITPIVRHVVGPAKVPVDTVVFWQNAQLPSFKEKCIQHLDEAATDSEIAEEVLSALQAGCEDILAEYIDKQLATNEPSNVARGLMVIGFSDQSDYADDVLTKFYGSCGFIGQAARAARYAYERNVWARHWYNQMALATDAKDFWRYSILFTKIVDARYVLWKKSTDETTELFHQFYPTIKSEVSRRVEKWHKERRDKLFGDKAPHTIFLSSE